MGNNLECCMNETQLAAHSFLMNHPEMIDCQRGAKILLTTCQRYVRKFYGLARTVGCRGCENYKAPSVLPKGENPHQGFSFTASSQWDDRAIMREFEHQRPALFLREETRERKAQPKKLREKRGETAKRKSRERLVSAKKKLNVSAEERRLKRNAAKQAARAKMPVEERRAKWRKWKQKSLARLKQERKVALQGLVNEIIKEKTAQMGD